MSWNIRIAGPLTNKAALKARVDAESMPVLIKDEIKRRIDLVNAEYAYNPRADKLAIYVESSGHLDTDTDNPYRNAGVLVISVQPVPYLDTPLEVAVGTGG